MSEAKDRYYKFLDETKEFFPEGFRDEIVDYVGELKQEKTELIEALKQSNRIMLGCNYVDNGALSKRIDANIELLLKHIAE